MDANMRIHQLQNERNWSKYRLAIESNLSQSTIANIFKRGTVPSITTLRSICVAYNITLSQFFQEGTFVDLTDDQIVLFNHWLTLSPQQKMAINDVIMSMKSL